MAIINLSKNTILAKKVIVADRFYLRLKGLLGRDSLGLEEALVIKPARGIHTFFMRFPIDVVFVDKENKIVAVQENLRPFSLTPFFSKSFLVIEFPAYTLQKTQTQAGDLLKIEP